MYKLTIKSDLPKDEELRVFLNGNPCPDDILDVPAKFDLRIEQYRESAVPGSAAKNTREMAEVYAFGGRMIKGVEISTPDRAIWESKCEVNGDAELTVSFVNRDGNILIEVLSDTVAFSETTADRVAEPEVKRRWLGIILPMTVLCSAIAIAVIVLVWAFPIADPDPVWFGVAVPVFVTVLALAVLTAIWYETISRYNTRKKSVTEDSRALKYKKTMVFNYVIAAVFAIAAVGEFILPLALHIEEFIFAIFPCFLIMFVATSINEAIKKNACAESGAAQEALVKLKRAIKIMIGSFAAVFAAMILTIVILDLKQ